MKDIKIQPTQTVMAIASHYKAEKDRALSDLELYLNRPTAVGGHSDVFDDLIKIFEKLEKSSNMLEMVETMIEIPQKPNEKIPTNDITGIGSEGNVGVGNVSDK